MAPPFDQETGSTYASDTSPLRNGRSSGSRLKDLKKHIQVAKLASKVSRTVSTVTARLKPGSAHSETKRASTNRCILLALPAELRNQIFELSFTSNKVTDDFFRANPPSKALLMTCRQIHAECKGMYDIAYRSYWMNTKFSILLDNKWTARDMILLLRGEKVVRQPEKRTLLSFRIETSFLGLFVEVWRNALMHAPSAENIAHISSLSIEHSRFESVPNSVPSIWRDGLWWTPDGVDPLLKSFDGIAVIPMEHRAALDEAGFRPQVFRRIKSHCMVFTMNRFVQSLEANEVARVKQIGRKRGITRDEVVSMIELLCLGKLD